MDRFVLKHTAPQAFDGAENSRPLRLRQDNQGSSSRPPTADVSRTPTPNVSRPPTPPIPADINIDELPYDPADQKRIQQYSRNPQKQDDIRQMYLTRGPYRQQPGFKYPQKIIAGSPRRFNPNWFKEYHGWLEYSEKLDGVFCLCCYFFRDCIDGQGGNDAFVVDGWSGWNNKNRLAVHVGDVNSFHNVAVKRCNALMNQDQSIRAALHKQSDITKKQNRIRLNTSVESVKYLVHQGLAFRGNDESEESKNKGNFKELLRTLANQNEEVRKVIRNAPKNCKWTCPDIQKEIASYYAKITLNYILEDIGGDVFSLLIDEASDVSDKEQMAVVLRYVNKHGLIMERLYGVVHVKETSATCLKSALEKMFVDIGLSLKQVRGQCYDGASNMRGEFNGLKAKILEENSSAYYVHCFAHQLQLVIVAVSKRNDDIADFFYMISTLFNVVGASCKRKDMIREIHRENVKKAISSGKISTGTGLNQDQSLQRAGETRWGSHYRTLSGLVQLFPSVISVLKYVAAEGKKSSKKSEARGLLSYFGTFDFVFYLHMMLHILGSANTLSQAFQQKDQDILNSMSCVKSTRNVLQQLRDNGWESLLEKVYSFCEEHDILKLNMHDEYVNRHNTRQKTNMTNLHHYQIECLNSVIDWQLREFDDRFNEVNSALLIHMASFSPKNSFPAFNSESLLKLAEFYPDDFDSLKLMDLGHELLIYIDNVRADERFADLDGISDLAKLLVDTKKHLSFPLVYQLLKLVLILPVATASVERCFSAMNIVKSVLRNKMGEKFMSDCLVCYVEKDIFSTITNADVINIFRRLKTEKGSSKMKLQ